MEFDLQRHFISKWLMFHYHLTHSHTHNEIVSQDFLLRSTFETRDDQNYTENIVDWG